MSTHNYWEHPHNERYYSAKIMQDLLDDWIVFVCWGKKNTKLGRLKYVFCENEEKAKSYLKKIHNIRLRHGYLLYQGDNHVKNRKLLFSAGNSERRALGVF